MKGAQSRYPTAAVDDDIRFQGMSLDVLAAVASDRLRLDKKVTSKKVSCWSMQICCVVSSLYERNVLSQVSKKPPQNQDRLNIEEINALSDRLIVSLFSDMSSDEIRRKYTFTCYLMPRTCQYEKSVFGNEQRAKKDMQRHLREHVQDLMRNQHEGACSSDTRILKKNV